MERKKKIVIMLIILFIIFIILFFQISKSDFIQDDLIFFQLLGRNSNKSEENKIKENTENIRIFFDIEYRKTKFTDISIDETINNKTLVNEKIAPGTKGDFEIELKSNSNINYNVEFKSKNKKPLNLIFYIEGDTKRYNTLEELGNSLNGQILKNENKIIKINWEWIYENNKDGDIQDTIDSKEISQYNFLIYAYGY